MKLITERDLIRGIADAWGRQYQEATGDKYRDFIKKKLAAMNLESATVDEVAVIIGNHAWTRIVCDICNSSVPLAVEVGEEFDYEKQTSYLCATCLTAAYALLPHNEE